MEFFLFAIQNENTFEYRILDKFYQRFNFLKITVL